MRVINCKLLVLKLKMANDGLPKCFMMFLGKALNTRLNNLFIDE